MKRKQKDQKQASKGPVKIKPKKGDKFNVQKAKKIMREVLSTRLDGKTGIEI